MDVLVGVLILLGCCLAYGAVGGIVVALGSMLPPRQTLPQSVAVGLMLFWPIVLLILIAGVCVRVGLKIAGWMGMEVERGR